MPVYSVCLSLEGGRDSSEELLNRFKPPYRVVKLSQCERDGLAEDLLVVGPIRAVGGIVG